MWSIVSEISLLNVSIVNQLLQVTLSYEGSVSCVEELHNLGTVSPTQHHGLRDRTYDILFSSDSVAESEIY